MAISAREIPSGTEINIHLEPVVGQPGLEALASRIASIFARWSAIEKQLDQMFTLITDADPGARAEFDALKGWDPRVDRIIAEADSRLEADTADIARIILKLVKVPAHKRDELAHRIWAVAKGFEDQLALLPPDDRSFAESVVKVKQAGRCDIDIDTGSAYAGSMLVSAADLDQVIGELNEARERLTAVLYGHLFPAFADATGDEFADYRQQLADDTELAARLINLANTRRQAEKAARRTTARKR